MDLQIFLLKPRKFSGRIIRDFNIFKSKFFHQSATYNPNILFLRRAVAKVVCFGDLLFDGNYQGRLLRLERRAVKRGPRV